EQLKHHTQALEAHTHAVEQRLRWWRRISCGLGVLFGSAIGLRHSAVLHNRTCQGSSTLRRASSAAHRGTRREACAHSSWRPKNGRGPRLHRSDGLIMMHKLKYIGHCIVKTAAPLLLALSALVFVTPARAQSRVRNAITLGELSNSLQQLS